MRILVATDGSHAASEAVRFAVRLAAASGGDLLVVTVVSVSPRLLRQHAGLSRPLASALDEAERRSAQRALDQARREALRRGARVRCLYLATKHFESIAETILRQAKRDRADLVIVGSRGGSLLARWALGSIANQLVHLAPLPVAIVQPGKGGSRLHRAKILVATDGSPASTEAVKFSARLASAVPSAHLVVMTVSTLTADLALTGAGVVRALGLLPELQEAERRASRRIFEAAAKQARLGKRVTFRYYQPKRRVFAADAIVAEARRQAADLVVLGRTGRTSLGDVILGSVAQRVLALAGRPVALVPRRPPRKRRRR